MNLSAKTEYACLAMLQLAAAYPNGDPLQIRRIADVHGIPSRFLVQILLQLKGAGLVVSTRGASGGYRLARPATSITLGAGLTAIEGPDAAARQHLKPAAEALAAVGAHVRAAERAVLDQTSIAQLAERTS